MVSIDELRFDEKGLIPAVVLDAGTGKLLMLAYMNKESLEVTLERGLSCFYSRSRGELWIKGETSGNYQHIVSITADCDKDALKLVVRKDGPACHLGTESCFEYPLYINEDSPSAQPSDDTDANSRPADVASGNKDFSVRELYDLLLERKKEMPEGSYTSYLFEKGLDKILKKVGEESAEVIIAGKARDKDETVYEIADLMYHVMVLMVEAGISVDDVESELASRHIIDHKVKQEKMV